MIKKITALLCLSAMLIASLCACAPNNRQGTLGETENTVYDNEKNLFRIATELVGEVDSIASAGSLIGVQQVAGPKHTAYQPNNDGFVVEELHSEMAFAEKDVQYAKQLKNEALAVCRTLGVWVKAEQGSFSHMYRLNYDVNTDVVTVEFRTHKSDYNSYRKLLVTHDANGRLVIDSYRAGFRANKIENENRMHYLEGEYFCSIQTLNSEDQPLNEEMFFIDIAKKKYARVYMLGTIYYDAEGNVTNIDYVPPGATYSYNDGNYFIHNGTQTASYFVGSRNGTVYYKDGKSLGSWQIEDKIYLSFNLNCFTGWSSVEREGDDVVLKTDKGEMRNPTGVTKFMGDFGYSISYYNDYDMPPGISFSTEQGKMLNKESARAAFDKLYEDYGISISDELFDTVFKAIDGIDEVTGSFHFINGIYGSDLTTENYYRIIDMLKHESLTLEGLWDIYKDEAIERNDQPLEYEYFEFLDFSLSGKAVLSDDGIDLSGISAYIDPSVLLIEEKKYSLIFAWASVVDVFEIGSAEAVYNGERMTFESKLTFELDDLPKGFGDYRLVAYVALDELDKPTRISKRFDISSENEYEYSASNGTVDTLLRVEDDAIKLSNVAAVEDTEKLPSGNGGEGESTADNNSSKDINSIA